MLNLYGKMEEEKKITTTVRTMINGEVNTEITKEDAF